MKKISILFLLALVCSCSNSDDSSNSSSASINPPAWIQGVWIQENSTLGNGYIFTSNDFLLKGITGNTSFSNGVAGTLSTGGNAGVQEVISNSIYNIDITILSQIYIYNFKKISETKIELVNGPTTSEHYYFIKQ